MTIRNHYMMIALLAGFGLALGACGSGSDSTPATTADMMDTDTEPTEPTPVAVDLPTLPTGDMYALEADTHEIAAGASDSNGGVSFMCAAGGEACVVTVAEDGKATSTGGDVTASLTAAAQMAYDSQKEAMMAEADGRAAGLHEALTRSDSADDIFGVGVTITPVQIPQAGWATDTVPDIVITRGLTGDVMVTRDRAHWEGDAMAAASLGAGWTGKVLTNGATQSVTVHSNIENAVREDFAADSTTSIYRANQGANAIPHLPDASTDTAGVLSLPDDAMVDAAQQGLLDLNYFPGKKAPASGTATYNYDTDPAPGPRNRRATFAGTFHGASGTYACTGGDCAMTVTPANATAPTTYTSTGGPWTFTPDGETNEKNDAQLVKQDNNWLAFGWWLSEPGSTGPGGEFLYNARVFYDGANEYNQNSIAGLGRLDLTYNGPAAGLYARQANATTGVTSARGEFSADAALVARYGVTGGVDVGGTITNFANGDGVDMSGWTLNLARTAVAADSSSATGADVTSGTATNVAGSWEYTLYGPDANQTYPSGIAGRFFAAVDGNTAVAGGFGAERQ